MRIFARIYSVHSSEYACCGCLHVKTGTILIGLFQVLMHLGAIFFLGAIIVNPTTFKQLLSTENHTDLKLDIKDSEISTISGANGYIRTTTSSIASVLSDWQTTHRKITVENQCFLLILTFISFAMTMLMICGTIKEMPQYLMPFFCLQVFDFCLSCLTVVGYFSSVFNVKEWFSKQPDSFLKDIIMKLDPQYVALGMVVAVALLLVFKAYCINIVWNCYRYLQVQSARRATNRRLDLNDSSPTGVFSQQETTAAAQHNNGTTFPLLSTSYPFDSENDENDSSDVNQAWLPPKYEDAIKTPAFFPSAASGMIVSPLPPPYDNDSNAGSNVVNEDSTLNNTDEVGNNISNATTDERDHNTGNNDREINSGTSS